MPFRSYLLTVFFTFFAFSLRAQTLLVSGTVLDAKTDAPVPFVSVGAPNSALGTVADALGHFRFTLPAPPAAGQQLLISCVGYETLARPLAEFLGHSPTVRLAPVAVSLAAVTVRPGKVKTKVFGRTSSSSFMGANLYTEPNLTDDGLAKEQGTVLPVDEECLLQDYNFHVAFNHFKSVKFRLNLYSVKAGLPDQPLLTQDIRFDVMQPRGWVKVDLRPYHIFLQGHREVAATLQWLQSETIEGNYKAFGVSAVPLPSHSVLTRNKSQAQWREIKPGYLSFYLTADSYRGGKPTTPAAAVAENTLPDSLRYLRYLSVTPPELPNRQHYGENAALGHYVAVQGAKLYVERYGKGEPLLLLHGNSQSISAFQLQIGKLAKHYEVIAVDTRAQGKSPDFTTGNLTYDLFAADIRQLLDSLNLRKVHVLGWSDGGNTALKLALQYPTYVNRMVLMGANLFPTAEAIEPELLQLLQRQWQEAAKTPEAQTSQPTRLLRLLLQEPHMTFEELHTITAPILVMAGQHDVIREAHTRAIAEHLPKAQLVIIPGASHYAPQEVPHVFNEAVLRFLGQPALPLAH
ncbi:alpha/beta fold hydrolase [Hymenobacter taeanensis]|uniref:Alpha/beta fold hydrolase n=1 Tax=Hymenobacter taeanensis TaxID=2735321 RepID=A0A6M6BL87_9BACT|nr:MULTISPECIES: alpha/beta fold hydrolase [Hymenobacter]QJX48608.1 alpha/beta fold hydrolase [Hymenobacter taeanensis]UOQ81893.1 alpha/beta fold hydrolase [Hymenobacter sp. 5414T-23]